MVQTTEVAVVAESFGGRGDTCAAGVGGLLVGIGPL
jgi:hypothetical protein